MATTIAVIIGAIATCGGVLWRFSSLTTGLQSSIEHLGEALRDLKAQIATIGAHGEKLAAHDARITNAEHRLDKVEEKVSQ